MYVRILDLDGSITAQDQLIDSCDPVVHDLRFWGPRIRMGCQFGRFRRFTRDLADRIDNEDRPGPALTFYGSGDFHHVSLALVSQIQEPFNLLILDKHPDWMGWIPFMHCGTWLYHAARLPQVNQIFHVGGELDFDNGFRLLAPWKKLRRGKIAVFPATRTFRTGQWREVPHEPVRSNPPAKVSVKHLEELLWPYRETLSRRPLYVSLDKDVLVEKEAVVNWDSGHLELEEICTILETFFRACDHRLVGMDIVGDWSPVAMQGLFRKMLDWTEHPTLEVGASQARASNQRTNVALVGNLMAEYVSWNEESTVNSGQSSF